MKHQIKTQLFYGPFPKMYQLHSNIFKKCLLCIHEKLEINNYPRPDKLLNKRSELMSKYHHANIFIFLLRSYKTKH